MAYNPWGNAVVERGHWDLKRSIIKLMIQNKQGWLNCLPTALFADQIAVWTSGYSPYFFMYGQRPRLHTEKIFSTWNSQAHQNIEISKWTKA
ncbi:hypothetical protein HMI55_002445 [Coelomomyces lativittatus]|nr:hypothetical protein HMI55_002445 [Coelomomyces lativittatus]